MCAHQTAEGSSNDGCMTTEQSVFLLDDLNLGIQVSLPARHRTEDEKVRRTDDAARLDRPHPVARLAGDT